MKKNRMLFVSMACFVIALLLAFLIVSPAFALQTEPPAVPTIPDVVLSVFLQFLTLAGVGALLAAIINILKVFKVVTDNTAGAWLAGLSLVAIAVLVYFKLFQPGITIEWLDAQAAVVAQILLLILGYVVQLFAGFKSHQLFATLRIPLIGKSYSRDA
jgi:hypothetical protein